MIYIVFNSVDGLIVASTNKQDSADRQAKINGENYTFEQVDGYVPDFHTHYIDGVLIEISPAEIEDRKWRKMRNLRDFKLAKSDWTQSLDAPVDQAAWAAYRQALRDLPANTTDPDNPNWPQQPS